MLRCLGVASNVTLALIIRERILDTYNNIAIIDICVTLTPYIKGPPGTALTGTCMSARQLTRESFDRYKVARKR